MASSGEQCPISLTSFSTSFPKPPAIADRTTSRSRSLPAPLPTHPCATGEAQGERARTHLGRRAGWPPQTRSTCHQPPSVPHQTRLAFCGKVGAVEGSEGTGGGGRLGAEGWGVRRDVPWPPDRSTQPCLRLLPSPFPAHTELVLLGRRRAARVGGGVGRVQHSHAPARIQGRHRHGALEDQELADGLGPSVELARRLQ
eukprot:3267524-Rhodomonas_salina.1